MKSKWPLRGGLSEPSSQLPTEHGEPNLRKPVVKRVNVVFDDPVLDARRSLNNAKTSQSWEHVLVNEFNVAW